MAPPSPIFESEGETRFDELLAELRQQHRFDLEECARTAQEQQRELSPLHVSQRLIGQDEMSTLVPTERANINADAHWVSTSNHSMHMPATLHDRRNSNKDRLHLRVEWERARHYKNTAQAVEIDHTNWQARLTAGSMDEQKKIEIAAHSRRCVISPTATYRMYWDLVGLLLVMFDVIYITLSVFDLPSNTFTQTMEATTLIFWTLDMFQSFFVAYYVQGEPIMTQPRVALHYVRTWFLLDLIVVGPDWFAIIVGSSTAASEAGVSRLLRIARTIRVLRLLRVTKLQRLFSTLYDLINDEYSFILAELFKMMMLILTINHVGACGWFLCAKLGHQMGESSWIDWNSKDAYDTSTVGYQYTTSLHWCLTQFTPASMDVVARNIIERVFSIFVLLFAMVAFSSIVGTVTSSMTVIRSMKSDSQKAFWMLRRYLKQKCISKGLTKRMIKFIEYTLSKEEKKIQRKNVKFLNLISDQLTSELAFEMYQEPLQAHHFFGYMINNVPSLAYQICGTALGVQILAAGDLLFAMAEEAARSFVLRDGLLKYVYQDGGLLDPPVQESEWIAEASLWTGWIYRGRCHAQQPSEVLYFNVEKLVELVSAHPQPWNYAQQYARGFVTYMNSMDMWCWSDLLRDPLLQTYIDENCSIASKSALVGESMCS